MSRTEQTTMQTSLVILALAWTLRAYAVEELHAINLDQGSGITLEESREEFPFLPDHMLSERVSAKNSQFMSTVMMFLERLSNEMSLLKEQAVKDRENLANLSSSVEILTQKVASLDVEVEVMAELVREYRTISDRLSTLERNAGTTADKDRVQQGCETSLLGSGHNQVFITEDPEVIGEPLYETFVTDFKEKSREGSGEDIGEETREGSGEDIGEESPEGSGEDGEPTFQKSRRDHLFIVEDREVLKQLIYTRKMTEFGVSPKGSEEDIGEESQEGSGEDRVKPVLEFDVTSDAITQGSSLITSLVVTQDRKIVMVDYAQKKVKVASLDAPTKVGAGLSFDQTPWSLALLNDGLVAVSTEDEPVFYIVNTSTPEPALVSRVATKRAYRGIAPGPGDMLIVSSPKDPQKFLRAKIDVISRDGHVIWTVSDRGMDKPFFLTRFRDELYVSDWGSHRVYLIMHSGRVETMFNSLDLATLEMYQPRVVAFDEAGNMYVATGGPVCAEAYVDDGWCVLVITRSGHWMNLINFNGNHDFKWPYGISLTPTGIVVSWGRWSKGGWRSELTAYSLPSFTEHHEDLLRRLLH